jgi:hypothetical protein
MHAVRGIGLVSIALFTACTGALDQGPSGVTRTSGPSFPIEQVRRLSQAELDNALRDLLGDDTRPASRMIVTDRYTPFDNDTTTQRASETLIVGLDALAEDVGRRAIATPESRARIVPCTPSGPGDEACYRQFLGGLLRGAFRREITTEDVDAYLPLLAFATEDAPFVDNDFYTAIDLAIRAVVQDPEFLYRIERGEPTGQPGALALDDQEIATRMAFLLWGTGPDGALLDDAAAGRLVDPGSRRAIAARMLADDRAREQLHRFHAMWLGYRTIPHDAALASAFGTETAALLDRVVFEEPQSYLNVFTMDETFVNAMLADQYGLVHPSGAEWGWVPYGTTGRGGILSHGSVLSAFSKFTDTSPTQRGVLVRTRLMCQDPGRPPPTVNVDVPPGTGTDAVCKSDRYAVHRELASCASCHAQIDPIGFGLERFDVGGRYREHDDGHPECAIDGLGHMPTGEPFSGPGELGRLVVDGGYIEDCVVEQWLTFAQGRPLDAADTRVMSRIVTGFAADDHSFTELMLDYVESDRFAVIAEAP